MNFVRAVSVGALVTLGLAAHFAVSAQDAGEAKRKEVARRDSGPAATLKVFEWGTATMNWDGSAEGAPDVPDFYYDASEVPVEDEAEALPPVKPRPPGAQKRKPVLYFECPQDLTFDLDVRFTAGTVSWMYPKPTRLVGKSMAQWDNIQFFSDDVDREKLPAPPLHDVPADHWASYSRDGSRGSLVVNGEHERFLFYEGSRWRAPEVDLFLNAEGHPEVSNYSSHELLDLRVNVAVGAEVYTCHVDRVAAAKDGTPGTVVLRDSAMVLPAELLPSGRLAAETQAAGLTAAQAAVFERAWLADFSKAGTMTWRRTQAALDELVELKLTLPEGFSSEIKRIGYVAVYNIDLKRQAEMEALVAKAAGGDDNSAALLRTSGTAGIGALRRKLADKNLGADARARLQAVLDEFAAPRKG